MTCLKKYKNNGPGIVAHTSNPSTLEAEQKDFCEFRASLGYMASTGPNLSYRVKPYVKREKGEEKKEEERKEEKREGAVSQA